MTDNVGPSGVPERATMKTILLVEDDLDLSEVIAAALKEVLSYHVLVAASGQEALKIVGTFTFDLFLLDYHLPDMDGLTVYEHLHAIAGVAQVPVLFLTAY